MKKSDKIILVKTFSLFLILSCFFYVLSNLSYTYSFFFDTATVSGTFATGTWKTESENIVINEVYYNVVDDNQFCSEEKNEWVELFNTSKQRISLKNWKLVSASGEEKIIHRKIFIPAGDFIVLSHDQSTWTQCWELPEDIQSIQWTGSEEWLNNEGDSLTLYDSDGLEVDFVAWAGQKEGWDIKAEPGQSIARRKDGEDTDTVDDWEALIPTPGTTNASSTEKTKKKKRKSILENKLEVEEISLPDRELKNASGAVPSVEFKNASSSVPREENENINE